MAYIVDRVVICDAFREPDKHYQLLSGGKSKLVHRRRFFFCQQEAIETVICLYEAQKRRKMPETFACRSLQIGPMNADPSPRIACGERHGEGLNMRPRPFGPQPSLPFSS